MRCRLAALQLLIAFAGIACTQESPATVARVPERREGLSIVTGCYALFDQAGRPAAGHLAWAPSFTRLDTARSQRAWKLDTAMNAEPPGETEALHWAIDSLADTVRITFHNGYTGTKFILGFRPEVDTLRGRAVEYGDAKSGRLDAGDMNRDVETVSAIRIPCVQ